MRASKQTLSIFSQKLDRAAFTAYFLGAVVPLVALAFVVERYVRCCQVDCVKYPEKGLSFRKPEFRNGAFLQDTSIFIATKARIR